MPVRACAGFTLVEMLTTVAALIILMGLAVSLAREVRRRSAEEVTRDVLAVLDQLMAQYQLRYGQLPPVPAFIPDGQPPTDRDILLAAAGKNNQQVLMYLQRAGGFNAELFGKLPRSMYDDVSLRDAWGSPVVFMPNMHAAIGMAQDNQPFFFSAGPDRNYLTREDNVYSYEGR